MKRIVISNRNFRKFRVRCDCGFEDKTRTERQAEMLASHHNGTNHGATFAIV